MKIKFSELVPNDYNPRKLFRGASMEELKNSIEQHGLIEPLVIRKLKNGKYEVIAGMRRYYCLKELNIDEVECHIIKLTETEAKQLRTEAELISLLENLQRENLTPIEEARAFQSYLSWKTEFGEKERQKNMKKNINGLAEKVNKTYNTIYNRLNLLALPEEIQNAIENEEVLVKIGEGIARLRRIQDKKIAQQYMFDMFEDYKKEGFPLKELNNRITRKIDFEKNKETEAGRHTEEKIKQLNKSIEETNEAIIKEKEKLVELTKTVSEKEGLDVDEDYQVESVEDVDTKKTNKLLKFLEDESEKYKDDTEYEEIAGKINELESAISDIRLLSNRTITNNLRICPYCHAGIDLKTIENKENIYQENLDELKKKREQISGMRGFLVKKLTDIRRQANSITNKLEFIKEYETELKSLAEPESEEPSEPESEIKE